MPVLNRESAHAKTPRRKDGGRFASFSSRRLGALAWAVPIPLFPNRSATLTNPCRRDQR